MDLPDIGDFDSAALASARTIDPAQWTSDEPVLGLVREAGYIWGTVRDADDYPYSVMRRFPGATNAGPESAGGNRGLGGVLIVLSAVDAAGQQVDGMRMRREAKHAPPSEELVRSSVPDGARWSGPGMQLDLGVSDFSYRESGVLDVHGTRTCPALQWYLPGPAASLLYLSQTWEVSGDLLGRPVRGFLFWEEAYMYPGGRLYVSKDPLHDAGYTSWYSWANRWDDGTTEVGHFLLGGRSFGIGIVANSDGDVQVADRITGSIGLDDERAWHTGIDYDLDGVGWRCDADPAGRMQLGPMPNPQQEGRIHRCDETRTPELRMAWGEVVPGRLP